MMITNPITNIAITNPIIPVIGLPPLSPEVDPLVVLVTRAGHAFFTERGNENLIIFYFALTWSYIKRS